VILFGLTGGIGTGKSTVAQLWRQEGLPVIDADRLAREVVAPGTAGLQSVVETFGPEVLGPDGALARERLAALVFSEPTARHTLDALLHPLVREAASRRFLELAEQQAPLACYEVPLLYEVGLDAELSPVVVVTASLNVRRQRLRARNGWSDAEIDARIAAQLPLEEKARRADYVLDNDGDRESIARGALQLLAELRAP